MTNDVRPVSRRGRILAASLALLAVVLTLLAEAPAVVCFALAIAAAAVWVWWVEWRGAPADSQSGEDRTSADGSEDENHSNR